MASSSLDFNLSRLTPTYIRILSLMEQGMSPLGVLQADRYGAYVYGAYSPSKPSNVYGRLINKISGSGFGHSRYV